MDFISKYFLYLFLFVFFNSVKCPALNSNSKIDSLERILKTQIPDTERVIILNKLSFQYVRISAYEKALNSGVKAFELSNKLLYKKGQAKSLINIGNVYLAKSDLENAKQNYLSALVFAKQLGNISILSDCNNNLGEVFRICGDYEKSLSYYLESLKEAEILTDKPGIAIALNNIGLLYDNLGNSKKAIESYKKSIKISKEIKDNYIYAVNLLNIAGVYFNDGDMVEALNYYQQTLALDKEINNKEGVGHCLLGIGIVYGKLNKLNEAKNYYLQCLKESNSYDNKSMVCSCMINLGLIYEKNGEFDKAIEYENKALTLSFKLGTKPEIRNCYLCLARSYSKINNSKKALQYFDAYTALNDSLYSNGSSKQIAEMQAKYETEKKQKENEVLEQKNQLLFQQGKIQDLKIEQGRYFIFGLLLLSVLIVGIAFLLIRQNKVNALHAKIEMEQKLLRSQMNPHFIFNAMVGIQNYIYKEEPEVAANYLSSIVHLMRSIIDNSTKEFVLLEKEISTLHHYLTLQKVRFQDKFNFLIDVDPNLDIENTFIPPMMAQPFIENAIVHGIMLKTNGQGIISVKFKIHNHHLSLEIEDNGIGREKAKEFSRMEKEHLSIATNITQERLAILNRKSKSKSSIVISDLKNESGQPEGTRVTFLFPLAKM